MKAVVAQVAGRHAVLLTSSGQFIRVRNHGYRPGQQIAFGEKRAQPVKALLIAASLMLFLLGGTGLAADRLPFSYVSLDVNPSIEYTLNWFDRVISLRAVNEDAEITAMQLMEQGVDHMPITQAVSMTLEHLKSREYFTDESENNVIIAVATYGLKNTSSLNKQLESSIQSLSWSHVLDVKTIETSAAKVQEARRYHSTAGKLTVVEEIVASEGDTDESTKEEWLKKSVRDIMKNPKEPKRELQGPDTGKALESRLNDGMMSTLPSEALTLFKTPAPMDERTDGKPQKTGDPKKSDNPSVKDREALITATPKLQTTVKPLPTPRHGPVQPGTKEQKNKEDRESPDKGNTQKSNGQQDASNPSDDRKK